MDQYAISIVGLLILCLISLVLASYSGAAKGKAGALAGPVIPANDGNPLYRIDRAHMNSVEAIVPIAVPSVLAMLVGVAPAVLAALIWLHLLIRLTHLVVYLRGGEPAKGGKLRTVLYICGSLVALVLILVTAWAALT